MSGVFFRSSTEAKKAGWFSRRHETADQHRLAQAKRDAEKSPLAKAEQVAVLRAERATRTPAEQIVILDQRLGVGQGAVRERARLARIGNK